MSRKQKSARLLVYDGAGYISSYTFQYVSFDEVIACVRRLELKDLQEKMKRVKKKQGSDEE